MFGNPNSDDEDDLNGKYRIYILKTLKNISLDLLFNTYSPERSDRVAARTKDFMEPQMTIWE